MSGSTFSVLFVCSGNICRSPLAEQLLRAKTVGLPVIVSSAGIIAREGEKMTKEAALVSRQRGGDPSAHRSRRLTEVHLQQADLVLTATRDHRGAVVKLLPRMSRRTFTISEFIRLSTTPIDREANSVNDLQAVVEAARSQRGIVPPPDNPEDDDIDDPYRRAMEVYEAVGHRIDVEIRMISDLFRA
ncbi:arsenate reductase/protein-tyrosine-phosphatase family protein [Sinomonas albida]|uniref:arsenate reductase/protein-tyrosine-phosphatase family protein n=1 Tax=Sinomonas albida TaxID=369942 RepID=UPI0010A89129|nr:low molecular weight phosphatase family protein [Sinomonas albida]